jgi:tripartite-type tricarboxylate transporter receptor subunit TctC
VLRDAVASDDVKQRIATDGAEPLPSTPEEYAADIDREEIKWSAIVKKSGAKAE